MASKFQDLKDKAIDLKITPATRLLNNPLFNIQSEMTILAASAIGENLQASFQNADMSRNLHAGVTTASLNLGKGPMLS